MHSPDLRRRCRVVLSGFALSLLALTLSSGVALAHAGRGPRQVDPNRTLSPYFHLPADQGEQEVLLLRDTRAHVRISGVMAHVRVTQTYQNTGQQPLEAVYVFPGSTRSAVFGLRMTLGERVVEAEIQERDTARKLYEQVRQRGQTASLLQQERPNVFQMNVANILPGGQVRVELDYVELLSPTEGTYEFVYPTVVGPRYSEARATEQPGEGWVENPHLPAGARPPYTWHLEGSLDAGMPVHSIRSPSHALKPSFVDRQRVNLRVDEPHGGDRDFVLRYRLAGDRVHTGLVLFEGEQENFFLAMVQPPARPAPARRPPREYVFIVDVSGSMRGFPMETSRKLIRRLVDKLGPQDRFNLMFFAGGSWTLGPRSLRATKANVDRAMAALDKRRGGGGTQILPALKTALQMPRSSNLSTSFVVITDGYVRVEPEAFQLVRDHLGEANLFTFGIGRSVNRHLIEGLARAGMAEPFVVSDADEAARAASRFAKYVSRPVLTDVRFSTDGLDVYDVLPRALPDLFAQRPVLVYGKYRGSARGSVSITGRSGRHEFAQTLRVSDHARGMGDNHALPLLWARHKVQQLSEHGRPTRAGRGRPVVQDESVRREITQLGLRYRLMTPFTSFVAVDSQLRRKGGGWTSVRQPLPMPSGVPDTAVPLRAARLKGRLSNRSTLNNPYPAERAVSASSPAAQRGAARPETRRDDSGLRRWARARLRRAAHKLRRETKVRGKVVLDVTAKADGTVRVRVVSSELPAEQLNRLVAALTDRRFSRAKSRQRVRLVLRL